MDREKIRRVDEAQARSFEVHLGMRRRSLNKGNCSYEVTVEERHLNGGGIAHGGFLFTLADNAAGLTAAYSERGLRDLVTQTATVHYIRAAQPGEHLVAEGRLVHGGRSTALVNVEIRNDAGKLLLQGEFSMFYLDPPEDE
ncbi:MAG: PaaI family thioesterase [Oscillospiraceae bacterium]|nr:PaaI family thioesterase [Oscillospiraceae bacterium]